MVGEEVRNRFEGRSSVGLNYWSLGSVLGVSGFRVGHFYDDRSWLIDKWVGKWDTGWDGFDGREI